MEIQNEIEVEELADKIWHTLDAYFGPRAVDAEIALRALNIARLTVLNDCWLETGKKIDSEGGEVLVHVSGVQGKAPS